MPYRFIDPDGREVSVDGPRQLEHAIRADWLDAGSLMFHEDTGRWTPAEAHPAYQRALQATEEAARQDAYAPSTPPEAGGPAPGDGPAEPADPDAPTEHSGREASTALRVLQGASLAAVGGIAIATAGPRLYLSEVVGWVIGVLGFSWILAAVVLVWSKRTRPFIPFAMLGIALLSFGGDRTGEPGSRTIGAPSGSALDSLHQALDRAESAYGLRQLLEGESLGSRPASPVLGPEAGTPPTGSVEDRMLWASLRSMAVMEQILIAFEEHYQVGQEHFEGWLEPDYFANASAYPQIPAVLERQRAFVEDLAANFESLVAERVLTILDEANLPRQEHRAFEASFLASLERSGFENTGMAQVTREFVSVAEELHRVLVANEDLIYVSPVTQTAEFRDVSVETRVLDILDDLEWYFMQVVEMQDALLEGMRGTLDQGRALAR